MLTKILFIYYQNIKSGSVAKVLTTLANELAGDYDITILLLMRPHESFYELDKRIKLIFVDSFAYPTFKITHFINKYLKFLPKRNNIKSYIYDFGAHQTLKKWLKENHQDYSTIISCWYKLSTGISLNKKIARKTIAWEHTNYNVGGKLRKDTLRPYYKNLKSVVCINKASENYYKKFNSQVFWIPNIMSDLFEKSQFVPFEEKENKISFLGRLDADKNVGELIDIFKESETRGWKLQIIGDGVLKNQLENYVKEHRLSEKIEFLGQKSQEESKKLLEKSKVFGFTSKVEGLPMVLIEAMFCSNVLLSYDCNYGPADIINENNGFLIPMHDKEMFRRKLEFLISNPDELEKLSKSAFNDAQNWKKEKRIEQWERILTD